MDLRQDGRDTDDLSGLRPFKPRYGAGECKSQGHSTRSAHE